MDMLLPFKPSVACTLGIELELQIINPENAKLVSRAKDLIRYIKNHHYCDRIKPEITQSMIEINSTIHLKPSNLLDELLKINSFLTQTGKELHMRFSGGGSHPFQRWMHRKIFPTNRFRNISRQYGYLAKQFTVFGQHIHVGCETPDDMIYLTQAFSRYIPQFIALSASSPYYQGIDTTFDSSRNSVVLAFPTSGHIPYCKSWNEFRHYYRTLCVLKIINQMKDIYWDIRPKPEFGTVEIRICDTPLTVKKAVMLAAYAQTIGHYLLQERPIKITPYDNMLYNYNRYQASRFGFQGDFINPATLQHASIKNEILDTVKRLSPHITVFDNQLFFEEILNFVDAEENDARWLRQTFAKTKSLREMTLAQTHLWSQ